MTYVLFKTPNSHIIFYTTKNSFKFNIDTNDFPGSSELPSRKIMQNKYFIGTYNTGGCPKKLKRKNQSKYKQHFNKYPTPYSRISL